MTDPRTLKEGSGSVLTEKFNAIVDVILSGLRVTASNVDSGAAQDGDVLTADGAGGAHWEAGGGSQPVPVATARPADGSDVPFLPGGLTNSTSWFYVPDTDWIGCVNFLNAIEATGVLFKEEVSTVGKNVRLAIYEADTSFQPSALLWQSAEIPLGVINSGDYLGTPHTIAFPDPVTFLGPYLFCCNYDGDAATDYPEAIQIGAQATITTNESGFQIISQALRPRTFGSFPDPGDSWLLADCELEGADPAAIGNGKAHTVPFGLSIA